MLPTRNRSRGLTHFIHDSQLRKGTLTPAVALAETTLMEDLNKDGRVTFKRSS